GRADRAARAGGGVVPRRRRRGGRRRRRRRGPLRRAVRGGRAADRRRPRHCRLPPARGRRDGASSGVLGDGRALGGGGVKIALTLNGTPCEADTPDACESLLTFLRERLGMPGAKGACEQGECGSCSVYLDGVLVCSCLVAAGQAEGCRVVTIEGLAPDGRLDPVQQAFLEAGAVQC